MNVKYDSHIRSFEGKTWRSHHLQIWWEKTEKRRRKTKKTNPSKSPREKELQLSMIKLEWINGNDCNTDRGCKKKKKGIHWSKGELKHLETIKEEMWRKKKNSEKNCVNLKQIKWCSLYWWKKKRGGQRCATKIIFFLIKLNEKIS